jgi:hypothetical protein
VPDVNKYLGVAKKIKKKTNTRLKESEEDRKLQQKSDINTLCRVERLQKMYESGKLRYDHEMQQTVIIRPLKLKFLSPIYPTLAPLKTFRILDYIFEFDSSGLVKHANSNEL